MNVKTETTVHINLDPDSLESFIFQNPQDATTLQAWNVSYSVGKEYAWVRGFLIRNSGARSESSTRNAIVPLIDLPPRILVALLIGKHES